MPNIASLLKSEIGRVARKEVKAETASLKKATTRYRSEIASLKRQVAEMQRALKKFVRGGTSQAANSPDSESGVKHRFSPKRLAGQRKRLDLSAEGLGLLIGVSGQSIYQWEQGKSRPRASHFPAIRGLEGFGQERRGGDCRESQRQVGRGWLAQRPNHDEA